MGGVRYPGARGSGRSEQSCVGNRERLRQSNGSSSGHAGRISADVGGRGYRLLLFGVVGCSEYSTMGVVVTWKKKLPEPPRHVYTAREVAASLAVSVQEVMDALEALGEFVASPGKKGIEEPVKRKVCEHLGLVYLPPAIHRPSPWQLTDRTRTKRGGGAPGRPKSAGPRDSGTRVVKSPDRSVGLGDPAQDASVTMEDFAWTYHGFSRIERDAWCVYLRSGQAEYAARLRNAGFLPDDLGVEVAGWSVWRRIRAGEPMAEVKRLLDRHRQAS